MPELDPYKDILNIITVPGIIQGFLLALIVLFYPKRDRNSNNLLSIVIITVTMDLVDGFLIRHDFTSFLWLTRTIPFVGMASMYLYIKSLSEYTTFQKAWKHYVVALALALIYAYFEFFHEVKSPNDPPPAILGIIIFLTIFDKAYALFYIFLCFKAYKKHKFKAEKNFSDTAELGLRWIKELIICFVVLFLMSEVMLLFKNSGKTFAILWGLHDIIFSAYLYFITIRGKLSSQLYNLRLIPSETAETDNKHEATHETDAELKEIALKAWKAIDEEQLYKKEGISIKELSDSIGVQSYLVSQAINSILNKNFFELINERRVEEAKKLLTDPTYEKYSLVAIGFEAGFSSKTSFNTLFKKYTGQTPSEYKKEARQMFVLTA